MSEEMREKANSAFFSGMIMGWASRLNENMLEVEVTELKKDMEDESKRLAKYAGVHLE